MFLRHTPSPSMYYTQGGRGLTDRQTEYKVERIKRVSSPVLVFYYKEIYATTGRMLLLLLLCKVRTWLELSKTSSVPPSLCPTSSRCVLHVHCAYIQSTANHSIVYSTNCKLCCTQRRRRRISSFCARMCCGWRGE